MVSDMQTNLPIGAKKFSPYLSIIFAIAPLLLALVAGIAIAQALFTSSAPFVGDRGGSYYTNLTNSANLMEIVKAVKDKWNTKYPNEIHTALAIISAESDFNPKNSYHNKNGSTDYGIFQINTVHLSDRGLAIPGNNNSEKIQSLLNPGINIDIAFKLFVRRKGWRDWSTYNDGKYNRPIHQNRATELLSKLGSQ